MLPQKLFAVTIGVLLLFTFNHQSNQPSNKTFRRSSAEKRSSGASPDLEIVRKRVIAGLLEPALNESAVRSLIGSVRPDGSWPGINYADVSRTGFEHSKHLENMFQLARAHKKTDSPWYQNPEVKEAALSALDFWLEHDFISDNWWWNEMGTPGRLINTLLVLDTDLDENQIRNGLRIVGRANLEASGARPGGDLIQIAGMLGKQALFRRDETILRRVVDVMAEEIRITSGRGLKADMSFHHRVDNVIATLSYGMGYASSFAYWAPNIAGTKYKFPEEATRLVIDYFLDGICKSMVHGKFPDPGAKNRDLSRKGNLNPGGVELAENLLKSSDYRKAELEKIVRIRKGEAKSDLAYNQFFWHSEYFTHQRPGYFASVRMHSSRNHTMEQPHNEEGLKMHHMADGSNFVSVSGKEYFDIFPLWDWQKIPGATIVQKPDHPHWKHIAKKGLTDFVGAVSDGRYGAAAMDFQSAHDPLRARKAWFFFDDEYVSLGTGIKSDAEFTVATTLNQCLLNGEVVVKAKKDETVLAKGRHTLSNVSWVYHDGVGYIFSDPQDLHISNAVSTGRWKDINHQANASAAEVQGEVFTLWMDHGVRPVEGKYEYIVLPAVERTDLDSYEKNPAVQILSNTASMQAVRHRSLNRAQVVFYEAGRVKVDDHVTLSSATPCIVMVKTHGKGIESLAVSDPTRKLTNLQLKISALIEGSGENWKATWDKKEKESTLDIALPQEEYAGQSVHINIAMPQ